MIREEKIHVRSVVLDTETTGLEVEQGHRIIEIGCIELRDRRVTDNYFHHYINPDRDIDAGAAQVHGINVEQLRDKPYFSSIADAMITYIRGAELIIHNAPFDVGFLDAELERAGRAERIGQICTVVDTLQLARRLYPGSRANLDALCKRYGIDNSNRELHGALLDARLLADVYLAMTGGQSDLNLEQGNSNCESVGLTQIRRELGDVDAKPLLVARASCAEIESHNRRIRAITKKSGCTFWPELSDE